MFTCQHSGRCCTNHYTQVSLTLGDIKRLSDETGRKPSDLFGDIVVIAPFKDPTKENTYDLELGLLIPCKFRIDKKCTAYKSRPLNCRIFPNWVSIQPKEKRDQLVDETYTCIRNATMNEDETRRMTNYVDALSGRLFREHAITAKFWKDHGFVKQIDLTGNESKNLDWKEAEKENVLFIREHLDMSFYDRVGQLLDAEITLHDWISHSDMPVLAEK